MMALCMALTTLIPSFLKKGSYGKQTGRKDGKEAECAAGHTEKVQVGIFRAVWRAVFATEDIRPGDLIERCPLELLSFRMNYHKDPTIYSHMFTHSCPCQECKTHGGHFVMVMGFGQMYNHQDDNSADIKFDLVNKIADIHARKEIKSGEEIFLNYGSNYFKNRKKIVLGEDGTPTEVEEKENN